VPTQFFAEILIEGRIDLIYWLLDVLNPADSAIGFYIGCNSS
jgi:hypothetical protein